jgi:hypothetical protein
MRHHQVGLIGQAGFSCYFESLDQYFDHSFDTAQGRSSQHLMHIKAE